MPLRDVLPQHRVNLIAGVSDAGKTRFILPAMVDWHANGGPPWAYIAGDRSLDDAYDTMKDMGFNPVNLPIIPAFGKHHKDWPRIIDAAADMTPQPQVLIVEGFQDLCMSRNDPATVRAFLSNIDAYLRPSKQFPQGLTIGGIAESAKQKPHEKYADPRQRVSGHSAWVYHSSTVLLIEYLPKDPEGLSGKRLMYVCMKTAPPGGGRSRRKIEGDFNAQSQLVFPTL